MARADERLRVAIVGLGPKGLFALERLLHHVHERGAQARLSIDLFEAHPMAGAGPVYDPRQPEYLLMNLAADRVAVWPASSRAVPAAERLSFIDWRGETAGPRYPPRAHVGRYLTDGLMRMRRHAPPGVSIRLRRCAVEALEQRGGTWHVAVVGGAADAYDEVLVTIGHGSAAGEPHATHDRSSRAGWACDAWPHAAALIPEVFPVTRWLAPQRVASGATVAVRGFALTFIDAALALTEGRGGSFARESGHPFRLRYAPTDADAGVLLPFSRSGRPMLAKPDPGLADSVPALATIARCGQTEVLTLPDGFVLRHELLTILAANVAAALLAANGHEAAAEPRRRATQTARRWLDAACSGAAPATDLVPAEEIERSLAVGAGLRPPDLPWALGHTWRSLYPALVKRLGGDGMAEGEWPAFLRLAAQMERVSFGPPPDNAAKLLALVAAGRVDLTHVDGATLSTRGAVTTLRSAHGERQVDAVVDAVLAPPGAHAAGDGVLGRLLADGHVRALVARRGLDVAIDAAAIGSDGQRTRGLSIIGRATEDRVIGNDTLSRAMHPQADRWALRVSARSVREAPRASPVRAPAA
jgi:uncharacterized NAD(P)/FAD-binding protein YdhS